MKWLLHDNAKQTNFFTYPRAEEELNYPFSFHQAVYRIKDQTWLQTASVFKNEPRCEKEAGPEHQIAHKFNLQG